MSTRLTGKQIDVFMQFVSIYGRSNFLSIAEGDTKWLQLAQEYKDWIIENIDG
uniref:Uncharacterized protein n=1 Tax=viral metagenome TaxID=1070528 RepID=A0A6H1ZIH0_9ZZZZ